MLYSNLLLKLVYLMLTDLTIAWENEISHDFWNLPWLLKILSELPGGILQTVLMWKPCEWLQLRDWTNIALSERHSAKTSPPE